jgi:phosphoglycerate-specific signal transduction histidine kinase
MRHASLFINFSIGLLLLLVISRFGVAAWHTKDMVGVVLLATLVIALSAGFYLEASKNDPP